MITGSITGSITCLSGESHAHLLQVYGVGVRKMCASGVDSRWVLGLVVFVLRSHRETRKELSHPFADRSYLRSEKAF